MLLSDRQVAAFRQGRAVAPETETRGVMGAYLVSAFTALEPGGAHEWFTVADTGLDHAALVQLREAHRGSGTGVSPVRSEEPHV